MTTGIDRAEFALSDEELASFHRNGYIGPLTVYRPDEMDEDVIDAGPSL